MRLAETLKHNRHYLGHVYEAMREFLLHHPELKGTVVELQCEQILREAEEGMKQ